MVSKNAIGMAVIAKQLGMPARGKEWIETGKHGKTGNDDKQGNNCKGKSHKLAISCGKQGMQSLRRPR